MDPDDLDGCELDFTGTYDRDDELPYVVLFAGCTDHYSVERSAAEWADVFR